MYTPAERAKRVKQQHTDSIHVLIQRNATISSGCSRISWGAASICCKIVVKWRHIAGLFYYIRGMRPRATLRDEGCYVVYDGVLTNV
jgi:hypothetical protein